jgi:hypothetical protein
MSEGKKIEIEIPEGYELVSQSPLKSASCCDSLASALDPIACASVAKIFIVVSFLS